MIKQTATICLLLVGILIPDIANADALSEAKTNDEFIGKQFLAAVKDEENNHTQAYKDAFGEITVLRALQTRSYQDATSLSNYANSMGLVCRVCVILKVTGDGIQARINSLTSKVNDSETSAPRDYFTKDQALQLEVNVTLGVLQYLQNEYIKAGDGSPNSAIDLAIQGANRVLSSVNLAVDSDKKKDDLGIQLTAADNLLDAAQQAANAQAAAEQKLAATTLPKATAVVCTKGKLNKIVKGVKPKSPAGYKAKR